MTVVYINYTSNFFDKQNKLNYYRFWYHGNYIDVKCKEPFVRGDIIEIESYSENEILIKKLEGHVVNEKIPVLVLSITKIPLNMNSDYHFYCLGKNDNILLQIKNIKNKNASYLLVVLSKEEKSKIIGVDYLTKNKLELVIE